MSLAFFAVLFAAIPDRVHAGGLYLIPLGVEPAARAGARVAGVSSPHALWYNPAGLAYSKRQLLVDLNMPLARGSFTRFLDNGTIDPTAHASPVPVPIPTIAYSDDFGLKRFGFGIGLIIPPAFSLNWPGQVNGQPAPQRFSILNSDNSSIVTLAQSVAYRPIERLSLGAALYLTLAQVGGEVAISACDYVICSQPEAPEWEGRTRFLLGPVLSPSAVFGARYDFDRVRVGGSVQVRSRIHGDAKFDVKLPDQSIFDGIKLTNAKGGDDLKAEMEIKLPTIIRLGVEGDLTPGTQLELAGTWENWANQKSIQVKPIDVYARDIPSIGDLKAESVSLTRNMRATWAVQLGGTHDLSALVSGRRKLAVHAGAMFESSSVAPRDLSPSVVDTNKVLLACGGTVEVFPGVLLDASYGHMFMDNRTVHRSRVLLPNALRPVPTDENPDAYAVGDVPAIGNGRYTVEADFVALGLRWRLDETRAAWKKQQRN